MDLNIREATPDDAEGVVNILKPIIEAGIYTVIDKALTPEYEREYIANFPKRGIFNVVEIPDGDIIGLQSLEPYADWTNAFDHVAIIGTYVQLPLRRQGIGTALWRVTSRAARDKGFEKIFTFVRADNPTSLDFHIKLGFRIVGTAHKQVKIDGKYIDEIIIERFL